MAIMRVVPSPVHGAVLAVCLSAGLLPAQTLEDAETLLHRFVAGDVATRHAILGEAAGWHDYGLFAYLARQAEDDSTREAALELLRTARRRYLAHPEAHAMALATYADPPTAEQLAAGFPDSTMERHDEAWLWPLVDSQDPRIVRRALVQLDLDQGLEVPLWIRRELLQDPMESVRRQAVSPIVDADEIEQVLLPMLAQGRPPVVPYTLFALYLPDLPAAARARLLPAMVAASLRARPAPTNDAGAAMAQRWSHPRRVTPDPSNVAAALPALGANAMAKALTDAAGADADAIVSMLDGARTWTFDAGSAAACAQPLAALLDHRDARVVDLAAEVAGNLLVRHPAPALRARLEKAALAFLAQRQPGGDLGIRHPLVAGCGNGRPPVALVPGFGGGRLLGASRAGVRTLWQPLLALAKETPAELRGAPGAPGAPALSGGGSLAPFAVDCLAELAPALTPGQAVAVQEALAAAEPSASGYAHPAAKYRLYAALPDEQARAIVRSLADDAERATMIAELRSCLDTLPEDRIAPLLPAGLPNDPVLALRVPERLNAAWRDDATRSVAAGLLHWAWIEDGEWVTTLVAEHRLDADLATAARQLTWPKRVPSQISIDELAALTERPLWTPAEEDTVIAATTDPDPAVRLAAFTALRTRDATLWDCRLFFAAARFDPNPAVRALAK